MNQPRIPRSWVRRVLRALRNRSRPQTGLRRLHFPIPVEELTS